MRATGIIRRIDELGRVVVPKEVRKTLKLHDGDLLEIYAKKEELVLKKYAPIFEMSKKIKDTADILAKLSGKECFITDTENIICSSNSNMEGNEIVPITDDLVRHIKINKYSNALLPYYNTIKVYERQEKKAVGQIIVPILLDGTVYGSVIIQNDKPFLQRCEEEKLATLTAKLIAEYIC